MTIDSLRSRGCKAFPNKEANAQKEPIERVKFNTVND